MKNHLDAKLTPADGANWHGAAMVIGEKLLYRGVVLAGGKLASLSPTRYHLILFLIQ